MAAPVYYQPSKGGASANAYHDYSDGHSPLAVSPISSPFDEDRPHNFSRPTPQTSHSGTSSRFHEDSDPFDDGNAIPLSGRKPRHESMQTIAPILPHDDLSPGDLEARDEHKRRSKGSGRGRGGGGWFSRPITWVVYVLTVIQLVIFIVEIVKNAVLTGSPIEIHPSFNPMIGPSPYVLINMGARYPPCMHYVESIQNSTINISWPCPNATDLTGPSVSCSLSDLCGFGGVPTAQPGSQSKSDAPNQWWRFIVPIFLHAGIVHIGFNLLLQITLGRDVEKLIGSVRFIVVYFASGIFGFVLGGNFAAGGIASTGCSGSLFGILAISVVDILYTWKDRPSPWKDIIFVCVDVAIAFVLGLLPGLDNFSHIGGFLMGLVLGVCILRSPKSIARRTIPEVTYTHATQDKHAHGLGAFAKDPRAFFAHRQAIWWVWWVVRGLALIGALVAFLLLLKNFYVWENTCSWCKYLSCLDVQVGGTRWCDIGDLNFTPQGNSSSNSRRSLFPLDDDMMLSFGGF